MSDKLNRNSPCICGSGKKFKKCCLNNKLVTRSVSQIDKSSVFIRLKDDHTQFVHPEGANPENPKEEEIFRIKEGAIGAGVWKEEEALAFIKHSEADNLEIVPVKEITGSDSSLN
jgi:uncharacterized protein YecA (UPF0149 family)